MEQKAAFAFCDDVVTSKQCSLSPPPALCQIVIQLECLSAFPVAAAQFWNRLPDNVTSANSFSAFRQQLKHTLFQQSFPDISCDIS